MFRSSRVTKESWIVSLHADAAGDGNPPTDTAHERVWQQIDETSAAIRAALQDIRAQIGSPPRPLRATRFALRYVPGTAGTVRDIQWYFPELGVAGQGRCACEAAADALSAFADLLVAVREHRDWSVIPKPDRSLETCIAVLLTRADLFFHRFRRRGRLMPRVSPDDAREAETVRARFAAAL
jgi:hypothetical protein